MSRKLEDVFPSAEELLELEPEEIAPFLLDYLCELEERNPRGANLSRHNFTLEGKFTSYAGEKAREVAKAIMEAWCWLEREGMLAPELGDSHGTGRYVTKKGFKYRSKPDLETYKKGYLLRRDDLDKKLLEKVYPIFLRGDYDTAVFQAFKEVEVRVRKRAKLSNDLIGTQLMRTAFNVNEGVLTDMELLPAERQAISDLFAGSIGIFKNPASHREINLNDPREAAELILVANYLLRFVDKCKVNSAKKISEK